MEKDLISFLMRRRHLLALLSIIITVLVSYGGKNLYLESDYKIFFEDNEPHLVAHEAIQDEFTKTDNLAIMLRPASGEVFTARVLGLIHELTEQGWLVPYAMRVDSITNFQNTVAEQDDLLVEDLLLDLEMLTADKISGLRAIALTEKQLVNRLVSSDGTTGMINISLQLPPEVDTTASKEQQIAQRELRDSSHPDVVQFGRNLLADYRTKYPDIEMHIAGVPVLNNSFNEMATKDITSIVPLMYGLILLLLVIFFRSIGSVISTLLVIVCASAVAMGSAGWIGYAVNTANSMTPTIVLTIAVCDAVHLLSVYLRGLSQQLSAEEAMSESLRVNLQPIVLTSITTAVGFLTLNFATSPPFAELGNMTAVGVIWAMVLTFTLLPAVTMLITRRRKLSAVNDRLIQGFARFIVLHRTKALIGSLLLAFGLMSMIPLNVIDDDPIAYFDRGVPYRDSMDFAIEHLPGVKDMNFVLGCDRASCVTSPKFLNTLEGFQKFLESEPAVVHVDSYIDVIKRLNRSMNADDNAFFAIPERADLAAQYNLMYEMSLPYGLDLNNHLNLDKSETKVGVLVKNITNSELIALAERSHIWLKDNHSPDTKPGSSVSIMFAHIGENNIRSMLFGGLMAIIGVTITILIALRSVRYAIISIIPNSIPAFMAFGVWGLVNGQVNMAVAMVFSISLGILVDDTVHFISKYRRGRKVKGLSKEQSIEYAFSNVGVALIITTLVLAMGFGLLGTSSFGLNSMAGNLTAITIVIALIFDFLILPPILMLLDREDPIVALA
jgi:predicted RND superfamily exporter protein